MTKWLKTLFSLNSLKKALGSELFYNATKFNFHVEISEEIHVKKALVLAPHPDDDCFGCGGTIKKITESGAEVTVAYFFDGSGGVKTGEAKRNNELVSIRKKEAKSAADILGVKQQLFFGYKDGTSGPGVAAIRALRDLIKRVEPDIIFVPSFLDNHPDHRTVNEILVKALVKIEVVSEIWAYEVWTPILANRIMLINAELDAKQQSIKAHESQLASRGYEKAVLGLNQYRAEINGEKGLAEAFFASTPEIYIDFYKKTLN